MRGGATAAVSASAVPAGIMASSRGRPSERPAPLSMVRRDRCFLVMNMGISCLLDQGGGFGCGGRRGLVTSHLEGGTGHDVHDQIFESVVLLGALAHDATHGRHVVVVDGTAQR